MSQPIENKNTARKHLSVFAATSEVSFTIVLGLVEDSVTVKVTSIA